MAVALAHPLSTNEGEFIRKALTSGVREDGRELLEPRACAFDFHADGSGCTVRLGGTCVAAFVAAYLRPPFGDRANEGAVRFAVRVSPLASPAADAAAARRPAPEVEELSRLVERGVRETRAVDVEALVVLPGRLAWHLEVDIVALGADGALVDACGLAALAALRAFRRPNTLVEDAEAGRVRALVLDPTLREEAACEGGITVIVAPTGELCGAQKVRAAPAARPASSRARARLALGVAAERAQALDAALAAHEAARVAARVRRHVGGTTEAGQRGLLAVPMPARAQADAGAKLVSRVSLAEAPTAGLKEAAELTLPAHGIKAEEQNGVGESSAAGHGPMDTAAAAHEPSKPEEAGILAPAAAASTPPTSPLSSKTPKRKRKGKTGQDSGAEADPYAAIAARIAQAGGQQGGPASLRAAVKSAPKQG
ncbi:hypothetical protein QBZ16_001927 [Prototheca wickerhamii]|uniref:Uncharacterized protein n=1 Tax=Prototheca wickerhamii TaxID=3111 RepID=A0AAD9MMF0_PROWI|nr:hypothetical protein QBZ16_001927 [Prototheca wickerhamii]